MVKCVKVELGVCQRPSSSLREAGSWRYYTIPVPAITPAEQRQEVATREFLNKHEDIFVHHTWIQSVGPEVVLEIEDDTETLFSSEGLL